MSMFDQRVIQGFVSVPSPLLRTTTAEKVAIQLLMSSTNGIRPAPATSVPVEEGPSLAQRRPGTVRTSSGEAERDARRSREGPRAKLEATHAVRTQTRDARPGVGKSRDLSRGVAGAAPWSARPPVQEGPDSQSRGPCR